MATKRQPGAPRLRSRIHGGPRCIKELVRIKGKVDAAAAYRENTPEQRALLHRLADALDTFIQEGVRVFPTWDKDPRDKRRARKRRPADAPRTTGADGADVPGPGAAHAGAAGLFG